MQLMQSREAKKWCEQRGLIVDTEAVSDRLTFRRAKRVFRVTTPDDGLEAVGLANVLLAAALGGDDDDEDFPGILLWLKDWDIGSETTERVGHTLLRKLRLPDPQAEQIREAPAHLFEPSERVLAHSTLTLPILFQWDAYVVPPREGLFMFISHEGYVDIAANTSTLHTRLVEQFRARVWPVEVLPGPSMDET